MTNWIIDDTFLMNNLENLFQDLINLLNYIFTNIQFSYEIKRTVFY